MFIPDSVYFVFNDEVKKDYTIKKSKGICLTPDCWKETNGFSLCNHHLSQRRKNQKKLYDKRRSQKICIICCGELSIKSSVYCDVHLDNQRGYVKKCYEKKKGDKNGKRIVPRKS